MKINSNWREITRTINGIVGIDGLNTSKGLGMKYGGHMTGPEEWAGTAFWFAGNCTIFVNSWEENVSLVELKTDKDPADEIALTTFQKLLALLEWKPWEHIPDTGTNRAAVKLYCEGKTYAEIADRLGLQSYSVAGTKIWRLRKKYPEAKIPKHQPRE